MLVRLPLHLRIRVHGTVHLVALLVSCAFILIYLVVSKLYPILKSTVHDKERKLTIR